MCCYFKILKDYHKFEITACRKDKESMKSATLEEVKSSIHIRRMTYSYYNIAGYAYYESNILLIKKCSLMSVRT